MILEFILANTKQAKKRVRRNEVLRQQNTSKRSMMRTYIKSVRRAILEGNKPAAATALVKASSVVDKMASKGIIHRNTAARYKSRMNARVKEMASA